MQIFRVLLRICIHTYVPTIVFQSETVQVSFPEFRALLRIFRALSWICTNDYHPARHPAGGGYVGLFCVLTASLRIPRALLRIWKGSFAGVQGSFAAMSGSLAHI